MIYSDDYIEFRYKKKIISKYYIDTGVINDSYFDLEQYFKYIKFTNCECNGSMGIYCKKCRGYKKVLSTEEDFFGICDKCAGYGEYIRWKNNKLDGLKICDKCNGRGILTWLNDFID